MMHFLCSNFMIFSCKIIFNPFHGPIVIFPCKALLADLLLICQVIDGFRCLSEIIIVLLSHEYRKAAIWNYSKCD